MIVCCMLCLEREPLSRKERSLAKERSNELQQRAGLFLASGWSFAKPFPARWWPANGDRSGKLPVNNFHFPTGGDPSELARCQFMCRRAVQSREISHPIHLTCNRDAFRPGVNLTVRINYEASTNATISNRHGTWVVINPYTRISLRWVCLFWKTSERG